MAKKTKKKPTLKTVKKSVKSRQPKPALKSKKKSAKKTKKKKRAKRQREEIILDCDISSELLAAQVIAELIEEQEKLRASGDGTEELKIPAWFLDASENM